MFKAPKSVLIVPARASGERLQNFLKRHLGEAYSGKRIKQIIDHYGCRVNGKIELFSSYKVRPGDQIRLALDKSMAPVAIAPHVLYEDEDLLVWDKPSGAVSEIKNIQSIFTQPLYLVHRLDKDTTGVMVLAKNVKVQKSLEALFKTREVKKIYHAIVQGESRQESFTVENRLGKVAEYAGQAVWGEVQQGLSAVTHFKLLKCSRNHLLLECAPVTGRTHQIRVHLAGQGLPIVGDYHYNRDQEFKHFSPRQLLHALSLSFIHPTTKRPFIVESPYPKDFGLAFDEIFCNV